MKLLTIIGLVLTCVIAVSEAHVYGKNGKNIAQKYGSSNYNGLRSGKIGVGHGVRYKVPNNYQGYQGKLGPHQYRFGRYRFGNYRYGRFGQRYGLGYGRYGQNYLRSGYKNGYKGKAYYDEEEQDASRYYPKKYGRYQHGIHGRRFGFGKYRYGRYGQQYGLGYGRYGQNYLRYGYKNGYRRKSYYDEEEQDASRYYPKKYGRYQHGIHGRRFGFGKYRYGRYGQQYGLGYGRYGQNYLRYGYKNGYRRKSYYDEEEQDASRYYPKKHGRYQYGQFGLRYGIGKYSYGKYGRRYGFSKYGYGKYGGRYGSQYGVLGRKYQGYGYGKGKVYYDRQEQDW